MSVLYAVGSRDIIQAKHSIQHNEMLNRSRRFEPYERELLHVYIYEIRFLNIPIEKCRERKQLNKDLFIDHHHYNCLLKKELNTLYAESSKESIYFERRKKEYFVYSNTIQTMREVYRLVQEVPNHEKRV